jgi:cytidylate kinase
MSAITISREFGSKGEYIAERIAQALDYHLVDKEFVGHLLDRYGLVEFHDEYDSRLDFWDRFNADREKRRAVMVNMLNQVMRAVAHHGNVVILGRSGFAALAGFADVLHVRLQAAFPVRVARVMAQQQMSTEQAEAAVRENDRVRAAFVEEFYGVKWGTAFAFDLVINTGAISPDLAVTWVVDAVKAFASPPETGMPSTRSIEVDAVLAAAVSDALGCERPHG